MFDSDDFEGDDFFKYHNGHTRGDMDIIVGLLVAAGAILVLALLCHCCRSKYRGRVLQPPPDNAAPAPYPQQQYSTVTVTTMPVGISSGVAAQYPAGGSAYPVAGVPYPAGSSAYPSAGAPYPHAGGPYPGAAPYPMAGAPYPAVAPYSPAASYPTSMPQPAARVGPTAPSAPDAHTLPPTYDQVMSNEAKHPPYNPYAPH